MVRSKCGEIEGNDWRALNQKISCLIGEGRLEVYDVSADFDESHRTGKDQVYHAMVVLADDVFEMNAQALMPNGINLWSGEVWEYDTMREKREKDRISEVELLPEQMKKAIWQRREDDVVEDTAYLHSIRY